MQSLQHLCAQRLLSIFTSFYRSNRYHKCFILQRCECKDQQSCDTREKERNMRNNFKIISKGIWETLVLNTSNYEERVHLADMGGLPINLCYDQFNRVCRLELCNLMCKFVQYICLVDYTIISEDIFDVVRKIRDEIPECEYKDVMAQRFYDEIIRQIGSIIGDSLSLFDACDDFEIILNDYMNIPFFIEAQDTNLVIEMDILHNSKYGSGAASLKLVDIFSNIPITCGDIFRRIERFNLSGILQRIKILKNDNFDVHYLRITAETQL